MAKRSGGPAWLMTFADLMSLLMAVFVLLFAMSTVEIPKYSAVVESLTEALGHGAPMTKEQVEFFNALKEQAEQAEEVEKSQIESLKPLYESLLDTFAKDSTQSPINIEYDEQTDQIRVTFPEQIAFDAGRADLKPEFSEMLGNFEGFNQQDIVLKVIGHTDKRPVGGGRFVSNWELSSARASSVIVELLEQGLVRQDQVEAIGLADTKPLIDQDTIEAYAKNRRVEVLISSPERSIIQ
ncbi:MAG: flagellar motor protein MotB [Pseudomonadota bacterium]|nr:flagellar motor protein MotB [Pseudomonadota bacterium]